jgi:hypothetical protein
LWPGAAGTFAVWQAAVGSDGLPDVSPGQELPTCLATVLDGTPIYDIGVLNPLGNT